MLAFVPVFDGSGGESFRCFVRIGAGFLAEFVLESGQFITEGKGVAMAGVVGQLSPGLIQFGPGLLLFAWEIFTEIPDRNISHGRLLLFTWNRRWRGSAGSMGLNPRAYIYGGAITFWRL
jgi:hypothetical protein